MKAAKMTGIGKIVVEEVPRPVIEHPGQVLIRVKAVGICGTDLHIFGEGRADVTLPRILGHELSGIVEETGDNVGNVSAGDHVILDPVISCGICRICRRGHGNVCPDVKCFGVQCDGGFCEYIVVEADKVYAYDRSVPFTTAALAEPFSIAANILGRTALKEGENLLVIGAGTIGLTIVTAARKLGARILAADIYDEKLAFAKKYGADVIVNAGMADLAEAVGTFAPEGMDVIIDATGSSAMIEKAVSLADPLCRIAVIGFDAKPARIPIVRITKGELTLVGSRMNQSRFPQVVQWLNEGVIDGSMVTKTFPLEQIREAFVYTTTHARTTIKTVITM